MEREVGKMLLKGLDIRIQWSKEFRAMQLRYQREAIWEAIEGLNREFAETFIREVVE